jgi:S1-C subfamily serine protease
LFSNYGSGCLSWFWLDGRLIGIDTAILSGSGGSQGVGFAIPSELARSVMESLVKHGHVTRGYLGIMIQDVTPKLAKDINRHRVKSADDAIRLTENVEDKHTLVRVWENGGSHYVVVDESEHTG